MNKLIISILMLGAGIFAYAEKSTSTKIVIHPKTGDRVEGDIPDVDYSDYDNSLSVKFDSDGSYSLVITDEFGQTECAYNLLTDGEEHSYQLPSLSNGAYIVEISNQDNSYSGEFYVGY